MTRLGKMGGNRRKHLEASEFQSTDLLQKRKAPQDAAAAASDVATTSAVTDSAPSTTVPATAAESTAVVAPDNEAPEGPAKKKKKMRHKSQMDPSVAAGGAKEPVAASEGDAVAAKKSERAVIKGSRYMAKKEHENLKRRSRRERQKERNMICFLCRGKGHSIKFCPESGDPAVSAVGPEDGGDVDVSVPEPSAEGLCYKCGSLEHRVGACKKPTDEENPYPYAHCFVCKKSGHISSACEQNEKGMYPNGGGCRFCGSVRHLAHDCKRMRAGAETQTLGVLDLSQGGDDDDVFIDLQKKQKVLDFKKNLKAAAKRSRTEDSEGLPLMGVAEISAPSSAVAITQVKAPQVKKKIIAF